MVMITIVTVVVAFSVILEILEIYNTSIIQKRLKSLEEDFDKYEKDAENAKLLIQDIKKTIDDESGVDSIVGAVNQNLMRIEQSIEGLKLGYKELAYEITEKSDSGSDGSGNLDELKFAEIDKDIYKGKAPRAGQMSFSEIEEYNKMINEEKPIIGLNEAVAGAADFTVEEID